MGSELSRFVETQSPEDAEALYQEVDLIKCPSNCNFADGFCCSFFLRFDDIQKILVLKESNREEKGQTKWTPTEDKGSRKRPLYVVSESSQKRLCQKVLPQTSPEPALKPAEYRETVDNEYLHISKAFSGFENMACDCEPPLFRKQTTCGYNCTNRSLYFECSPLYCRKRCENQKIQKHEWSPGLERFTTANKGWGVRTTLAIERQSFILEYVGQVISQALFEKRMGDIYRQEPHHYCLYLDSKRVIDAYRVGNEGRFVNHSCQPNCVMQKWSVNGVYRMALFSLRDIAAGEELTFDYNFQNFNKKQQVCFCDSPGCRGFIRGKLTRKERAQRFQRTSFCINYKPTRKVLMDEFSETQASGVLENRVRVRGARAVFLRRNYRRVKRKATVGWQLLSLRSSKVPLHLTTSLNEMA